MNLDELMKKYFGDVIAENPAITEEINTIFEGAVSEAVAVKITEKETVLEASNTTEMKTFKEMIVEKLDEYISLAVEEFTEENKTNIETNTKVELAEKTFAIVKTLFTEAAIEIPEDQKTIIEDLEKKNKVLSDKLNESVNGDIDAKKQIFEYEKTLKFVTLSEDLSDAKKEKLMALLDNINCENIEDFEKKTNILKNSLNEKKEDKKKEDKNLLEDDSNFEADALDKYLP